MIVSLPAENARQVPMFRQPGPEPCLNGGHPDADAPMNMAVAKSVPEAKLQPPQHGTGWMSLLSDQGPSQPISILLVEDDAPTLWRLQDALAKAGFQVTSAATLAEARASLAQAGPQVLLTDLQLPDGHGNELIRETRQRFPDTEIMVISILGDEESVISAITVGATGYLLKDAFPTDIAATVRELVAGHSPISASIARFIVRRTQSTPEPPPGPPLNTAKLTPREIDILWGIAKGFSYAEIAGHLGLSRQTVPGHIKNIYRKLEVHTRGEAVFEALQQGLIRL
jgi:DNA-binding NarL/FixJ family response regulator